MSGAASTRQTLTRDAWAEMAADPDPPLLALWADTREVYALLRQGDGALLVSTEVEEGGYLALSPVRPAAAWFERVIADLWGHNAIDGVDRRACLDHGRWASGTPMAVRPGPPKSAEPPDFAMTEELDQIPLGPVRGGIQPAVHLRLGVRGEAVERLEARFGYTHRGVLALMRGKSPRAAARFAARLTAGTTVAHSLAFARATEAALACDVPPRAQALRAVMADLEQIIWTLELRSAVAEADGMPTRMSARGTETLRTAAAVAFGHRLMMDSVIPGGVAADITRDGPEAIERALQDAGEAEIVDGARLHASLLALPDGPVSAPLPATSGEGLGRAMGPAGDVWHWLRLDHGQIACAFMCDPGWARWQRLEATLAGGRLDDVPRNLASLGLSSSGMDL